ncbi:MAG TPA: hypothetical protein VF510_16995, partial [Ktedonobacterales bacterium]
MSENIAPMGDVQQQVGQLTDTAQQQAGQATQAVQGAAEGAVTGLQQQLTQAIQPILANLQKQIT